MGEWGRLRTPLDFSGSGPPREMVLLIDYSKAPHGITHLDLLVPLQPVEQADVPPPREPVLGHNDAPPADPIQGERPGKVQATLPGLHVPERSGLEGVAKMHLNAMRPSIIMANTQEKIGACRKGKEECYSDPFHVL